MSYLCHDAIDVDITSAPVEATAVAGSWSWQIGREGSGEVAAIVHRGDALGPSRSYPQSRWSGPSALAVLAPLPMEVRRKEMKQQGGKRNERENRNVGKRKQENAKKCYKQGELI